MKKQKNELLTNNIYVCLFINGYYFKKKIKIINISYSYWETCNVYGKDRFACDRPLKIKMHARVNRWPQT